MAFFHWNVKILLSKYRGQILLLKKNTRCKNNTKWNYARYRMTQASFSHWSEINTSWKAGIGPALFTSLDFKFSYNFGGLGVLSLMYQIDLGAIKVNWFCRFQSLNQNATTGVRCKLQTSNASFFIHFRFSGVVYVYNLYNGIMVIMCFFIIPKNRIQKLMSFLRFTSWTIDLFTEHRPMEFRPYDIL